MTEPHNNIIYVLFDPDNSARASAVTLDSVTRTLIEHEMPNDMWNRLFGNRDPLARKEIYAEYGWTIMPVMVGKQSPIKEGTVHARFNWLIDQLEQRFPGVTSPYDAQPPEPLLVEALDKALQEKTDVIS